MKQHINRSEYMAALWRDPIFRARQESYSAMRSQAQKERWKNPEYRERIITARKTNAAAVTMKKMQIALQETLGA